MTVGRETCHMPIASTVIVTRSDAPANHAAPHASCSEATPRDDIRRGTAIELSLVG